MIEVLGQDFKRPPLKIQTTPVGGIMAKFSIVSKVDRNYAYVRHASGDIVMAWLDSVSDRLDQYLVYVVNDVAYIPAEEFVESANKREKKNVGDWKQMEAEVSTSNNRYAVVLKADHVPLFEGNRDEIYEWIRKNGINDEIHEVCSDGAYMSVAEFFEDDGLFAVLRKGNRNVSDPLYQSNRESVSRWLRHSLGVKDYEVLSSITGEYVDAMEFIKPVPPVIPEWVSTLVPQYYRMDPETEDMLTGDEILDGMVVLIGDSSCRAEVNQYSKGERFAEFLLERNRWCTVTKRVYRESFISFIGVYEGGEMFQRVFGVGKAWLVKKDSMPASVEDTRSREERILEALHDLAFKAIRLGQDTAIKTPSEEELNQMEAEMTEATNNTLTEILDEHRT